MHNPLSQNYQKWYANTSGEGACILGSATPPIPRQRCFSAPQFLGFSCIYIVCLHPLTQNDQIRHGNTYGEGRVTRSATPFHLHKCVVQFVSDSWVSCSLNLHHNQHLKTRLEVKPVLQSTAGRTYSYINVKRQNETAKQYMTSCTARKLQTVKVHIFTFLAITFS